jgi:ketosteroid isomerase-like protein
MPRMSARATAVFLAGIALLWVLLPRLRPATDDVSAVRDAEATLDRALARSQIRILDNLIGSDFSTVGPDGRRETRSEFLDRLRDNPWKVESLRQENLEIHFYGGMAVVTGADRIQARDAAGQDRSGDYRFLHVFQKRDGRWLLIAGLGSQPAVP